MLDESKCAGETEALVEQVEFMQVCGDGDAGVAKRRIDCIADVVDDGVEGGTDELLDPEKTALREGGEEAGVEARGVDRVIENGVEQGVIKEERGEDGVELEAVDMGEILKEQDSDASLDR